MPSKLASTHQSQTASSKLHPIMRKIRPYAIHGVAGIAVISLAAFGSGMTGYTKTNATYLLARNNPTQTVVDETASSYIAANVASGLGLNLATKVSEDVEVLSANRQLASESDAYLRKASAVTTDAATRTDIATYTVKPGDTVEKLAKEFNITSNTIRWANDLTEQSILATGDKLKILPINGVVHKVATSDNPKQLAKYYQANEQQIISFNDAEVNGLKVGQQIVVPDGVQPAPVQEYVPVNSYFASVFVSRFGGNTYYYGYCTWYVASQVQVPSNWGDAAYWDNGAIASGWSVSPVPSVGAIAQNDWMAGGIGHVALVEAVSADGKKIKISDMNNLAGWGQVGIGWVPTSQYKYITR